MTSFISHLCLLDDFCPTTTYCPHSCDICRFDIDKNIYCSCVIQLIHHDNESDSQRCRPEREFDGIDIPDRPSPKASVESTRTRG